MYCQTLTDEKVSGPMTFQLRAGTQPIDGQLLAFLRLFCMTKKSLGNALNANELLIIYYHICKVGLIKMPFFPFLFFFLIL